MPKAQKLPLSLLFASHKNDWENCTRCPLHETRKQVVIGRGALPCDVLFVGEAPGESENVIGKPFVGPAGHLLDRIIRRSMPGTMKHAVTNLVGCIPRNDDGKGKVAEPDPDDIIRCSRRLDEFVEMASPRIIVCVGKLAENWIIGTKGKRHLLGWFTGRLTAIVHPAAILRANVAAQGLMIQKAVISLTNALEELN